jgi:hypothetical protein
MLMLLKFMATFAAALFAGAARRHHGSHRVASAPRGICAPDVEIPSPAFA